MTLKEFNLIRSYLPEDIEIEIIIKDKKESSLVKEEWCNHDDRYNMRCTLCGWVSPDIPRHEVYGNLTCPKCNGKGDKK